MTSQGIRERATSFFKMFGSELGLEFYHDGIASGIKEILEPYTAESLTQLIKNSEMLVIPSHFIEWAGQYKELVKEYSTEQLTAKFFELIYEVRPDLGETIGRIGDEAATWLLRCVKATEDEITNPERYAEEVEKALTVKVTCDSCGKSWRVFKEDMDKMKMCCFCGASAEEPSQEEPKVEEEEE